MESKYLENYAKYLRLFVSLKKKDVKNQKHFCSYYYLIQ